MQTSDTLQATEEGRALQKRLTDQQTLAVMNRLLDRIDSLERTVERLTAAVEQGPGMAAIAVDVMDEEMAKAGESGVDVEARMRAAAQLLLEVSNPNTINRIKGAIELADRLPGTLSMVGDMADDAVASAQAKGIDLEARGKSLLALTEKLTAPETMQAMEQLMSFSQQAPGLASMVADMADDAVRRAQERGIDLESRGKALIDLTEKLTAPETMQAMEQLMNFSQQAPGLASMVADMADDAVRRAQERGIDLEERAGTALSLAEQLTAPEMVAQLQKGLEFARTGAGTMAMMADMFDELAQRAMDKGIDLDTLLYKGLHAAHKGYDLMRSEAFDNLLESPILQEDTLQMISKAGDALVAAQSQNFKPVGAFGMVGQLNNSEVKQAMGFLLTFAREFGKRI